MTCNKHDLKTWCKRSRARSANSRLICRIWKIQKSRRETIRPPCVPLNDQGTLTETTKAKTSSNWGPAYWTVNGPGTPPYINVSFLEHHKEFDLQLPLGPYTVVKKSSKHHNCRGRRGETKRQIQMMVSPKKNWYLTYPPGNSQTFKSIKVLSKRTFLCPTRTTDSFTLQMEIFRFFRNIKLRAFFMFQNLKKDICATHEDIFKPKGTFCLVVNNHSMNTFTPGKGRGKKQKQNWFEELVPKLRIRRKKLTYWERKVLDALARDRDIIKSCDNGWGIATMASV